MIKGWIRGIISSLRLLQLSKRKTEGQINLAVLALSHSGDVKQMNSATLLLKTPNNVRTRGRLEVKSVKENVGLGLYTMSKSLLCGSLSSISKPLLPCRLLLLCWAVFKKFSVGVFYLGKTCGPALLTKLLEPRKKSL